MKIEGIGNVNKEDILSILSRDGREAVKSGEMSMEEAADMYKLHLVKKASKIGRMGDTFNANFKRIPEALFEKLSPEELAALTDAFYNCYSDGKDTKKEG